MILNRSSDTFDSPRKVKTWDKLRQLIEELGTMKLKPAVQEEMVRSVQELNVYQGSDAKLISLARKKINGILRLLEKEMNVVPKNEYRLRWLALGMSVFGVPMGVVFGLILENMAFLGIGLPIGLTLGIAIGNSMDHRAAQEGRQLNFER